MRAVTAELVFDGKAKLQLVFDVFSSREPVFTSLENALTET